VIKVPSQKERAFGEITSEFRIVSNSTFIDEKTFLGALKAYASGNAFLDARREGLLFIHGFDESFERAAFRNAQFVYDGCLQITPILFSWPSRDTFPGYLYDRDSVIFSRDSLAKLIKAAANRNVFARFDVFAHSMGNWAVLEAIRNIYGPSDSTVSHKPMIDNLILASPDIDIDVFRQDLPAAKRAARSVTLFTSRRDFLLGFSQTVAFGDPRVGNASLDTLAVHGITAGSNLRIVAMDERASGDCGAFEHRCSETNPVVMAQIRLILQGN
jgi:esterase/lipase superfamily enzyme